MTIEQFVAQSSGKWRSMRSGHSLAFQQFEEVLSEVTIEEIDKENTAVQQLIESSIIANQDEHLVTSPFRMEWCAESDWEPEDPSEVSSGSCIIVPLTKDNYSGKLIRSVGYAESEAAISEYQFLDDGTFTLTTQYEQSIAEERIWFVSENVRCRSSVLRTSAGSGILQTSFASEVRRIKA
ncbi:MULTISPECIES: phycobiliprotein lyase [unclassified Synechococcus]|uniref:phycobiliprotein lyase n=1 Tax=unclassified Synechococcus TaxID=2626047 RepID=UPI001CF89D1F|nr:MULTISPECIES: phycobiliprotein lyase [unclassified Synechococcus]MCB4377729.1 phycobiliprotein lyase [Synechococcus sp. MU1650]